MYICSFQEYFSGHPNNRLQSTKSSKSPSAFADQISINYFVQIDIIITVLWWKREVFLNFYDKFFGKISLEF